MLWQRKDPRCIQSEVISYRRIGFSEKIDQKDVQQQHQQQMEKDRVTDDEVELIEKGIKVVERMTDKRKGKVETERWHNQNIGGQIECCVRTIFAPV